MPTASLEFQSALAAAHRDGQHGLDPSGYWRQTGCPYCGATRLNQAEDFEVVKRHDVEVTAQTVWVLREVKSRGIWTIVTFGRNPECDFAVGPWGDLADGGYNGRREFNVPAGIWHKLSQELA